ncbi:MAG: hypothetical protein RLP12_06965, partial [Ekhidna sp.]
MRNLILVTFCLIFWASAAQKGDFLLTNHFPRHSNIDNSNFEITNDSHGRLCIANRSGVLYYDGEAWDFYQTPSAALSIAVDTTDIVYVGCIGSIGMIDFQGRSIRYNPILKKDTINDLFLETHHFGGKVYFMGSENLIVYDIASKEVKHHKGNFINIYELDAEMFVNTANKTYLINDSLSQIVPAQKVAYSSKRKDRPNLVIGFDNSIYTYESYEFSPLLQNKHLEKEGFMAKEIQWLNDSLFVCTTYERGLVLYNMKDPEYAIVTDYHSGLPDNEVYTIHTDNSNGIWAAHQFGITHI